MAHKRLPVSDTANLTLVLGVDGSGKSTFLQGLQENFGTSVFETTSSPVASAFKRANVYTPVDSKFVDRREAVYMALNPQFNHFIRNKLTEGVDVATTGNDLVTMVSHGVMRSIVSSDRFDANKTVSLWLESESLIPDEITFIHAKDEVLHERIASRRQSGDTTEQFWGFNSPYFLSKYQETWHEVMDVLATQTVSRCVSMDSGELSPREMLDTYAQLRLEDQMSTDYVDGTFDGVYAG